MWTEEGDASNLAPHFKTPLIQVFLYENEFGRRDFYKGQDLKTRPPCVHRFTHHKSVLTFVLQESGDIILSGCAIVGELGGVVRGANRHDPARTTVFKSLGLAVEDVAAARLVLDLCS